MADKVRLVLLLFIISGLYFCSDSLNKKHNNDIVNIQLKAKHIANFPDELFESSGLLFDNHKLFTINDNAGLACIYGVDSISGKITQEIMLNNTKNFDWEDITSDSLYFYIGDFGNNFGARRNLRILKIKKSEITNDKLIKVTADSITFDYKNQLDFRENENTSYDCEAMITVGNFLYLFSMNRGGNDCAIYKLPKDSGHFHLSPIAHFDAKGRITGATYNKSKNEVLLIGYSSIRNFPFIWRFNNFKNDEFTKGNQQFYSIGNEKFWQTEGITFAGNSKIYFSCEVSGENPAGLYQVNLD